jgi:serine/threonine-protein kinase
MSVPLGMGVAIAIFGSYKISELQQEALQARRLGQYVLKRRLGKGGMGEVYLGEHLLLRRACAIKLIRPDQAGDPTNLSRFEREVKAMAALTHWNTVEIYDYGHSEDGTFYYVMEYLPGLSLQDLVERCGPLPPERAAHFLRQLCGALSEAHALGVIHRDLKPSNVIVGERGGVYDVAKLLDFGLVHCLGCDTNAGQRLTIQGTILGSPPYMAPEQARGKDELDGRTDIYSLGAVAYFLLTGQSPFARETAMEMLVAAVHEQPPHLRDLRPEVPADLADVVMRCLEKAPAARYQDADSLEQALAQCDCADLWGRREARAWWREYAADKGVVSVTADPLTEESVR